MLTRILHNSPNLCEFIGHLDLPLTEPQRQHVINLVDALLVCDTVKTLSELQRQFVQCVDASNMADTLRIAPWTAETLSNRVGTFLLKEAINRVNRLGLPKVICISLDDSLGGKDKATHRLEVVDWHYDHTESSKGKPRFKNGFVYLDCNLWIGGLAFTYTIRLYLREETIRRLNRNRASEDRLHFASKNTLLRRILKELKSLLPEDFSVYVLFDIWYASARSLKYIYRQGWHTICAIKSNRKLDGQRVDQRILAQRHRRYAPVVITAADNTRTTYLVRDLLGRLEDVPFNVRVLVSKRHYRDRHPAYFVCTDLSLGLSQPLQWYAKRWGCETDNFYLKTRLGLGDFRVQSYEATDKWCAVVHLGWAYVQWRLSLEQDDYLRTPADVIRRHRDEHTRDWLVGACQEAIATGDVEAVVQRFMREDECSSSLRRLQA
jgi:hypothetical protein